MNEPLVIDKLISLAGRRGEEFDLPIHDPRVFNPAVLLTRYLQSLGRPKTFEQLMPASMRQIASEVLTADETGTSHCGGLAGAPYDTLFPPIRPAEVLLDAKLLGAGSDTVTQSAGEHRAMHTNQWRLNNGHKRKTELIEEDLSSLLYVVWQLTSDTTCKLLGIFDPHIQPWRPSTTPDHDGKPGSYYLWLREIVWLNLI